MPVRRKLGQSQSFPAGSMKEYVARMQTCSDIELKLEGDVVEEVDEDETDNLPSVRFAKLNPGTETFKRNFCCVLLIIYNFFLFFLLLYLVNKPPVRVSSKTGPRLKHCTKSEHLRNFDDNFSAGGPA